MCSESWVYPKTDAQPGGTYLPPGDDQCTTTFWWTAFWQWDEFPLGFILNQGNGIMRQCEELRSGVSNVWLVNM